MNPQQKVDASSRELFTGDARLHGVYHHASKKHLFRYVDEFTFRLNEGNVENHTIERLNSFVDAIVGKRLTYKQLIAAVPA